MNFLSKAVWALLQPGHLLLFLFVAGWVMALFEGTRRPGLWLGGSATLLLVVISLLPLGALLLRPLENRFPDPEPLTRVDGIVVLGGGQNARVMNDRQRIALNDAGERLIEAGALIRRFPGARVIFTGGNGPQGMTEADVARRVFAAMGLDTGAIAFESQARNTVENARLALAIADPRPGEVWLLVTSAYHMPRSVGTFRAAGWNVLPYPVDYRLSREGSGLLSPGLDGNLRDLSTAMHEYVGLLAYRAMGRTEDLFPAP